MPGTVVVVEDEPAIAAAVADRLRSEGFDVEVAVDGPAGVALCERVRPDLVVLDLMLPGLDGIEVCRRIQRERHVPVVMLTARDDETDLLIGFGVGADDYVTKPFSPRELVARIRAVLRRVEHRANATGDVLDVGDVRLDGRARSATFHGLAIHLTPTEFDLVWCLASRRPEVLTRDQLLFEVWGYRDGSGARTVDSHIRAVRRKLGDELIRTVHGVGYAVPVAG